MSQKVNITLHNDVIEILRRLETAGFEAYSVGGYVRDSLMGRVAGDCDITTSALPEETKAVFSDLRTIDTGIKHGTVTVLYDGEPYEITTYRVDGEYADSRHPDSVSFTASLDEDLARRDFTVNAMAYSDNRGLVDLFGGRADIESRRIRAVGDPGKRFTEDALRMLRALRFASVLDFEIEPSTREAIFTLWHRIESVSAERILVELRKLVSGVGAYRVMEEYSLVIKRLLRGIEEISLPDKATFDGLSPEERLIAVFYLSSENPAEAFSESMLTLRSDRRTERFGSSVLSLMRADLSGDRLYEAVLDQGSEAVGTALSLKHSIDGVCDDLGRFNELTSSSRPTSISDIAVGGRDIIALGYSGADVGALLRRLTVMAMSGELSCNRDEIIEYIKNAPLA